MTRLIISVYIIAIIFLTYGRVEEDRKIVKAVENLVKEYKKCMDYNDRLLTVKEHIENAE